MESQETPPSLSYATESLADDHRRRARIYGRFALGFAVTPMSLGAGILLLYWLFDWDWLIPAGMVMLPVGGLSVLTGLIFTVPWVLQQRKLAQKTQTEFSWRATVVMVLLLLSNFGVAVGCLFMGASLVVQPTVMVTVYNDSGAPLDKCSVHSLWSPREARVLATGESMEEGFKMSRSSGLHLHIEQTGKAKDVPLTLPKGGGGMFDDSGHITIHVRAALDVVVETVPGE